MLKILKQTAEHLTLQIQPSATEQIGRIIFAGAWIALFLVPYAASVRNIGVFHLTCQWTEAEQVECESVRSTYFGLVQQAPVTVAGVRASQFVVQEQSKGRSDPESVYTALLITRTGATPLLRLDAEDVQERNTAATALAIVNRLNTFIRSTETRLSVQQDNRWDVNAWVGLLLILAGGLWIVAPVVYRARLELDRPTDRLIYRGRHFWGWQTRQYALDEVKRVELRSYSDDDEEPCYLLLLMFERGAPLVLWENCDPQSGEEVIALIQDVLDRPRISRTEGM
ncbi:hypothetical protein H6F89_13235 [Cyanobacteria bacterium FACHB-63]|nr:hypothetical protein [Cyanobacteria bacterium FACHB-63]